jgi:hypothetical protein
MFARESAQLFDVDGVQKLSVIPVCVMKNYREKFSCQYPRI